MPDVDLTQFPIQLAEALGITTFAGEMLASCIVIALFVFPTLFLTKKFSLSPIASLTMAFLSMGFCVAIGWLNIFFILMISVITALMFAGRMREWISG